MRLPRHYVKTAVLLVWFLARAPAGFSFQAIEGLVHVRFQADVRLFAVTAALNLAGFDMDAEDLSANPTRKMVRQRLAAVDPDLQDRLRRFYQNSGTELNDAARQGRYVSYALFLQGPPRFALTTDPTLVPAEIQSLIGFERLVAELWEKGNLATLWNEARAAHLTEIESYRPLLRSMIIDALHYLHTEARLSLDRQMILIPDLLTGFGLVNARNIDPDYIVVVGPSRAVGRPMGAVRHEYLHFLVDPLIAKHRANLPDPAPFLARVKTQPRALPSYGENFSLMLGESLIRVLEPLIDQVSGIRLQARVVDLYDQGLVLAPYFEEALNQFAQGRESLQEFFPTLIQGVRWTREEERERIITRKREEIARQQAESNQAGARPPDELRNLLIRGNQLLQDRQFTEAKEVLEKVLAVDEHNAGALFGMAQVASHDQDLATALEYYRQAALHAGSELWIAAWSFLHRGNILLFQGDRVGADAEWARILKLEGNLRGADEAARKALAQ